MNERSSAILSGVSAAEATFAVAEAEGVSTGSSEPSVSGSGEARSIGKLSGGSNGVCSSSARRRRGLPDELVAEEREALADGFGVEEAHGFLVAGLAEQAPPRPEHDREDDQPQLVDEVVLDERATEPMAARDDDFAVELPLEL